LNLPQTIPYLSKLIFSGRITLKSRPESREVDPRTIQSRFYLKLSSTVFSDFPPYRTIKSWIRIVVTRMNRKSLLLKKF
jgi:hypothetical protein